LFKGRTKHETRTHYSRCCDRFDAALGLCASKLSDFPLADRIKADVASGKPLEIYVSYHDVSNEFRAVHEGRRPEGSRGRQGRRAVHRTDGSERRRQISEIETLMGKMDGLGDLSVSSDALRARHRSRSEGRIPVVTFIRQSEQQRLAFAGQDLVHQVARPAS